MKSQTITVQLAADEFRLIQRMLAEAASRTNPDRWSAAAYHADSSLRELADRTLATLGGAIQYRTSATVCEGHPDRRATWELAIFGPVQTITMGMCDGCALAARTDTTTAESPEALVPLVRCESGHWVGTVAGCSCSTLVPWA